MQRTPAQTTYRLLRPTSLAILLALGCSILIPTAWARTALLSDHTASADYAKSGGKSRAAAQAQAQHGGKVLSVSESRRNGQIVYKVKLLLDSGRIKIVTIQG